MKHNKCWWDLIWAGVTYLRSRMVDRLTYLSHAYSLIRKNRLLSIDLYEVICNM